MNNGLPYFPKIIAYGVISIAVIAIPLWVLFLLLKGALCYVDVF